MTDGTKSAAFYADFGGLATLKGAARNQDPKALKEAARQFESLFTQMMLKNMRQASSSLPGGDSLMDNDQSKMYLEMFDNQLSMQLSKGRGLGLADMLVRQLTQNALAEEGAGLNATKVTGGMPLADPLRMPNAKTDALELMHKGKSIVFPVPAARASTGFSAPAVASESRVAKGESTQLCGPVVAGPARPIAGPLANPSQSAENPAWTPTSVWQMPAPASTLAPLKQIESIPADLTTGNPGDKKHDLVPTVTSVLTPKQEQVNVRPQPLAKNAADFVRQLWPHALQAARELGVDAKTLVAHAALETGWGKFVPCNPDGTCSFNLFGIKTGSRWKGPSTAVNTLEYEGGVAVKKRESFRTYESAADSFRDYASFIKNSPRYAAAVGAGGDAAAFATALQQGGYATDPLYATKLASVAARLESMAPKAPSQLSNDGLKVASSQPLTAGRSVSTGDET